MKSLCVLATESFDPSSPYFRWLTPGFELETWCALSLPTIEATRLLGQGLYRQVLLQVVRELRPHVLLTIPPFDFLDAWHCNAIRSAGTRIVGWLSSDFGEERDARIDELYECYDLLVSPCQEIIKNQRVRDVPWALSSSAVSVTDPAAPRVEVALIAPHTDRRECLAKAIAGAGHQIACFGQGWALGPLTRPSRLGIMKAAAVTIVHNDQPLLLVEACRLGVPIIVERGLALSAYLPPSGGPASFECLDECIEHLNAGNFQQSWTNVPDWPDVLQRVVAGLGIDDSRSCTLQSPSLAMIFSAISHSCEHANLLHSSLAGYQAWAALAPDDIDAKSGLARLAFAEKNYSGAAEMALEALRRVVYPPVASKNLPICLARRSPGNGLGLGGALDQIAELRALRLTALVEDNRIFECFDEIKSWTTEERAAVQHIYAPRSMNPEAFLLSRVLSGELAMPHRSDNTHHGRSSS